MLERKINLEEILFTEVDKMRKDFPDINLYSNEEMKNSPEWKYYMNAIKEACRQVLELAAENAKVIKNEHTSQILSNLIDKQSILNTINQVE